ncbi:hypothetical protein Vadar_005198 [Vaccinium darrowii]|uniref:Uncharacterized protein n=1 Tax=Vaccinium darrowii TaxID=229202 RepID=A0ACB7Y4X4_9ERIC|nr:hypothetical protein Vadar_005198 [Vaccinium darrowii]
MIKDQQQNSTSPKKATSIFSGSMERLASQRTTWVFLSIMAYTILFLSSWVILKSILSWYSSTTNSSPVMIYGCWLLYALAALGVVLGLMSMAVALAMLVPATVVAWFIMLVLLTLCGKSRREVLVEERKLMAEVRRVAMKILIRGMLSPLFVPFWVILLLLGGAEKMLGLLRFYF